MRTKKPTAKARTRDMLDATMMAPQQSARLELDGPLVDLVTGQRERGAAGRAETHYRRLGQARYTDTGTRLESIDTVMLCGARLPFPCPGFGERHGPVCAACRAEAARLHARVTR